MNIKALKRELAGAGLNLLSILDRDAIAGLQVPESARSLILIGNSGPQMWRSIPAADFAHDDPVDNYARRTVVRCLERLAVQDEWQLLFPTDHAECPPLQLLGRLANWHTDSPLGTGINATWGLWYAYRAVVAVSVELESDVATALPSACLSCESQACIQACPGAALALGEAPDLRRCGEYRLGVQSACQDTCVARVSCPVATQWRYDDEQIRYHYRLALPVLAAWLSTLGNQKSD